VAGHNWPVYLRFKGGKGVATSTGALLGIAPAAMGICFAVWVLVFVTTRYVSAASIGAALILGVSGWLLYIEDGLLLPVTLTILGVVAIGRHRANIQRLVRGDEHRFQFSKKDPG
jgi:glycerol-3-phosphate acyltransferase PlsY